MKLTEKLLKEQVKKAMNEWWPFRKKHSPSVGGIEGNKGRSKTSLGQQETFKDKPTSDEELAAMQQAHAGAQKALANSRAMKKAQKDLEYSGLTGLDVMGGGGGGSAYVGSYEEAVNKAIEMADEHTNAMDVAGRLLMKMAPKGVPDTKLKSMYEEIRSYMEHNAKKNAKDLNKNGREQMAMGLKHVINKLTSGPKNESFTLSTDDIRKMIREEFINLKK